LKKEAKLLLNKAINSLILAADHFNRLSDRGRVEAVLILLDHSFEMQLKAAIIHRGGRIRKPRAKETLGFDACVRKALSDNSVKFLHEEQALTLQIINSLRDAAQHHLIDVPEPQLYMVAQAGLTLFKDIYENVFSRELCLELPERVLPISTTPPSDLSILFKNETNAIRQLLSPGTRRGIEAKTKLRALAIMECSVKGERVQPGNSDLNRLCKAMQSGKRWEDIFPGVALINFVTEGTGPSMSLRIMKKEGIPITLVKEGTPGASVVAVKRVDELGFYNLGRDKIAKHIELSGPKTTALIRYLRLEEDPECFKKITIGKSQFKMYSQKAIPKLKEALERVSIDEVWSEYRQNLKKRKH